MSHKLYVDPQTKTHRYELCVAVDAGVVQAEAKACCILDDEGRQVQADVSFAVATAELQALVDTELIGKKMAGKGHIELWIRDGEIEQGKGTGPWFHYRENVAASGLVPERQENRNPVLPADTIPYASIQAAAVGAVNSAIA